MAVEAVIKRLVVDTAREVWGRRNDVVTAF
jgi:hypothetical protein